MVSGGTVGVPTMHDTGGNEAGRLVDMDRHIQQTNDRLVCIKQHLQTPANFQSAARELLEWCSDTRAFQPQFEEGLMGCLTVVSKVASQPGYDLELGYRLLAVCASHKDMFTAKSAGLLSSWSEEQGRALLLRHQKKGSETTKSPPAPHMHPQMQKAMPPGHPGGDGSWAAGQGGPGNHSLSVVTTVWGVTPATQSGPFTHNPGPQGYPASTMTGNSTTHMGPQPASFPNAMHKGVATGPYNPQAMPYRRDSHPRYAPAMEGSTAAHPHPHQHPPMMPGQMGGQMMAAGQMMASNMPNGVTSPTSMAPNMTPMGAGQLQARACTQVQVHAQQPGPHPGHVASPPNAVGVGGGVGVGVGGGGVSGPRAPNASSVPRQPLRPASHGPSSPLVPGPAPSQKPTMQPSPLHGDTGSSGYPPTPNTPGSNPASSTVGEYTAPPGALSAAAFVAAAATATATATATASMVALQEQQNQQQQMNMNMQMNMNQQYGHQMQILSNSPTSVNQAHFRLNTLMGPGQPPYGPQYGPGMQRHPSMPMAHGGPGPMMGKGMGPGMMPNMGMYGPRRTTPYPTRDQIMHKRQMAGYPNGTQMEFGPGQMGYPNHQYKPGYPPTQQPLPSPTYGMPHHQGMRPVGPGPGPYPNGQSHYMMQSQYPATRPPTQPGFPQYPSQPNNFQPSPISGNPTPPMTPGAGPPYAGDMKPAYPPDIKPHMIKRDNDELRLTFPVRDGVVLPPFRLEHNLAVSNHVFHLRESVYQTLMWRSDLELQLKCFHHEDRQMNTNWPASVTVSVNATPLSIERGENKSSHKPLYLKDVCQGGRNTIQITVTACCCSHLFVLQLVHRPSIRSVLQGLLRKRLLPAEHCITKIKRNFSNVATSSAVNGDDGVEQTAIKVPLKCPITCRRITLPARGHDCKHIQCFDLESYLQLNCERGTWRCPVCNKTALLEGLEIDQYIWAILTNLSNTEFDEVTIDQAASWKPVPIKTVKQENDNSMEDACSRWMKAMSPSSMQLPTMSSWDVGPQQPSPYPSMAGPPPPQGDPVNPAMRHPDPSQPANHMAGRPPSLPGRMTPQGGPGTPQQQNGSHPLSHPPPVSSSSGPGSVGPGSVGPSSTGPGSVGPASVGPASVGAVGPADCPNLPDLNFDPTAIMNGEPNASSLDQLLPENLGDPFELLSYLGPPDNENGGSNGNANNSSDDILAFFES